MTHGMTQSLRTLLSGLIDYAGLFPPASLEMQPTVENYNRYTMGEEAFALGRLICPVTRLDELTMRASALMPGTYATSGYREMADSREPWRISAIVNMPLDEALVRIDAFNEHHAREEAGLARIDALEMKVSGGGEIDDALEVIPNDIMPYFEIPGGVDPRGAVAALAGEDAAAKFRCGGVKPEMIPGVDAVAEVLSACVAARVPLKFTAGLHHPIRGEQALTYDAQPVRAVMHGFVNVFVAGAMLSEGVVDESVVRDVLLETDAGAFAFSAEGVRWRDRVLELVGFARARERFVLSYGSCSFTEPIADLRSLGWI